MVEREKKVISNRLLLRCCFAAASSLLRFPSAAKQQSKIWRQNTSSASG